MSAQLGTTEALQEAIDSLGVSAFAIKAERDALQQTCRELTALNKQLLRGARVQPVDKSKPEWFAALESAKQYLDQAQSGFVENSPAWLELRCFWEELDTFTAAYLEAESDGGL